MTRATLYALPGSHPSAAAAACLDAHGVPYDRVDLVPVLSRLWLRAARFAGGTVPALRLDGCRIVGSRAMGDLGGCDEIERWGAAAALAHRVIPRFEGRVPPVFPPAWLPQARRRALHGSECRPCGRSAPGSPRQSSGS